MNASSNLRGFEMNSFSILYCPWKSLEYHVQQKYGNQKRPPLFIAALKKEVYSIGEHGLSKRSTDANAT